MVVPELDAPAPPALPVELALLPLPPLLPLLAVALALEPELASPVLLPVLLVPPAPPVPCGQIAASGSASQRDCHFVS